VNSVIDVERFPWKDEPAMIIGADVSHPAAFDTQNPSISAMVASLDTHAQKYVATSSVQPRQREETIQAAEAMAKHCVRMFRNYRAYCLSADPAFLNMPRAEKLKRLWPCAIIYYRDGLGEGQYAQVTQFELTALQNAVEAVKKEHGEEDAAMPYYTFIIVTKRHHQRFFPNPKDADPRTGNCPPGSAFDLGIGHPTLFDFYLQSHYPIKGTGRPGHYIVTHDDCHLSVAQLQQLSYDLCYTYARATRSVSIPAPVYYADLVCGRANIMYDPAFRYSDSGSVASEESREYQYSDFATNFKPLHKRIQQLMFFV